MEVEWRIELEGVRELCDVVVRSDGRISVLADAPNAVLIDFDGSGRALATTELHPGLERRSECGDAAIGDAEELWATTAVDRPILGADSWVHRIGPDGAHSSVDVTTVEESALRWIVAARSGAVVGGWERPTDPNKRLAAGVLVSLDRMPAVREHWSAPEAFGVVWPVSSTRDSVFALAKQASLDYGDAYLLRREIDHAEPSWVEHVGGFGDLRQAEVVASASTETGVLLARVRNGAWSVAEFTTEGEQAWEAQADPIADESLPFGAVAADERVALGLLGSPDPIAIAMSLDGDCLCEGASPLPTTTALSAAPQLGPVTFIAGGAPEDAPPWLARVRFIAD